MIQQVERIPSGKHADERSDLQQAGTGGMISGGCRCGCTVDWGILGFWFEAYKEGFTKGCMWLGL